MELLKRKTTVTVPLGRLEIDSSELVYYTNQKGHIGCLGGYNYGLQTIIECRAPCMQAHRCDELGPLFSPQFGVYFDAIESKSRIWIANANHHVISVFDTRTRTMQHLIECELKQRKQIDGDFSQASFKCIRGIMGLGDDKSTKLYVLDKDIRVIDINESTVRTVKLPVQIERIFHPTFTHISSIHAFKVQESSTRLSASLRRATHADMAVGWAHTKDLQTVTINYNTFAVRMLHSGLLFPIATLSPRLTLAVHLEGEHQKAYLVLVSWPLLGPELFYEDQNGANDFTKGDNTNRNGLNSEMKIVKLVKLHGMFMNNSSPSFVYQPLANRLYVHGMKGTDNRVLDQYDDFLHDSPPERIQKTSLTGAPPNFSALLHPDAWEFFPPDIIFEHNLSRSTIRVHSKVLLLHAELTSINSIHRRFDSYIKYSSLPYEAIYAFFASLYSHPLELCETWEETFLKAYYISELYDGSSISPTRFYSSFYTNVLLKIAPQEVMNQTQRLWHMEKHSFGLPESNKRSAGPFLSLLISFIKREMSEDAINEGFRNSEAYPHSSIASALDLWLLLRPLCKFLADPLQSKELKPELTLKAPKWDHKIHFNPKDPKCPKPPFDYIFSIQGLSGGVQVSSCVLYPQWRWFERLVKSGLWETKTRNVVLPSFFTPRMLLDILSLPYGFAPVSTFEFYDENNTLRMYSYCKEYQFDESPCFEFVHQKCKERARKILTEDNSLATMTQLWLAELTQTSLFKKAVQLAREYLPLASQSSLQRVPQELRDLLTREIHEEAPKEELEAMKIKKVERGGELNVQTQPPSEQ